MVHGVPFRDPAAQRAYQRQWLAKRRAEFFAGKVCCDCGADENLELDHRDPNEKVDHRIWSWTRARIEAETAKCDVRCRDCHVARHGGAREAPCGTRVAYQKGCRCRSCKGAQRDYHRARRAAVAVAL